MRRYSVFVSRAYHPDTQTEACDGRVSDRSGAGDLHYRVTLRRVPLHYVRRRLRARTRAGTIRSGDDACLDERAGDASSRLVQLAPVADRQGVDRLDAATRREDLQRVHVELDECPFELGGKLGDVHERLRERVDVG